MVSLGVRSGLCFLRGATSEHVPAKLGYNVRSLKQIYESFFTLGGNKICIRLRDLTMLSVRG